MKQRKLTKHENEILKLERAFKDNSIDIKEYLNFEYVNGYIEITINEWYEDYLTLQTLNGKVCCLEIFMPKE